MTKVLKSNEALTICIDRGGTFTDCIGFIGKPGDDNYREFVVKLLSEDPSNYKDAPTEGIRRIVELANGTKHPRSEPVPTDSIGKTYISTHRPLFIFLVIRKCTYGYNCSYKCFVGKKR
jgi:5-oxoprolinase (ATP-hydrolysing)